MLCVAFVALAFGWPTRNGGYIAGDDERLALNHVYVNHPSPANAARLLAIVHGDLYQPLPVLSFQLNYALAEPRRESTHGVSLYGFHLTNILLHAINAALVFLVASRLVPARRDRRIGLLTALFFACHPFAVEPVAWISGRTILLATLFSLLLLLGLPFGRSPLASVLAWLLALASKVLPTVPLAAIWCDWRIHGRIPPRRWTIYVLLILMGTAATFLVFRATSEAGFIDAMQAEPADPVPIRILLAARYYLENYVWPNRLAGWSPPPQGHSYTSPPVLIALLEYAALFLFIALTWRRHRTICLGLVLFLILIAPFLAASVARRFLAADRYMYLPILGLHLAVAAALVSMWHSPQRSANPLFAGLTKLLAAALLIAWFCVGWHLGPTWTDNITRNQRAIDVYRDNVLAHVELAKAFVIEKQPDEALATIAKARQRWPDHPRLAGVAGEAHRLKKDWPAAAHELRRAAAGLPHHLWTLYYLARTLDDMGQADEARALYNNILNQHASYFPALVALARNHEKVGNISAAIAAYERAIGLNPHDRDALLSLAVLRIRQQHWSAAEPPLRSILQLDPDDFAALLNLGVVFARTHRTTEALAIYDRLVARDPAATTPRLNRAALLAQLNRPADAEADFRAILAADPGHRDAAIGLHELLQQQHRYPELPALWQSVAATGESDGVQAWIVWAEALAGNLESAQRAAMTIDLTSPHRAFADWALAYLALRENRTQDFKNILSKIPADRSVTPASLQQARIIRLALLDLPDSTRDSPAGLFALANALLYDRQTDAARTVLSRIMERDKGGRWGEAAEDLYRRIESTSTHTTTSAPNQPA